MSTRFLAGDFSGIQRFVLQVKSAGKAQAKRLRARSFLLELVERAALWHVEQRFNVSDDDILVRGGGGFLVQVAEDVATECELERLNVDLQRMLWDEFGGEIQFAMGWGATPARARAYVECRKRQPGRPVLQTNGTWEAHYLSRPSLGEPCEVCGRFPGVEDIQEDDEGRIVRHCRNCLRARRIGADLTRRTWLRMGRGPIRVLEAPCELLEGREEGVSRVGRWIPRSGPHPLTFEDLARQSRGDPCLAVLKADVDDMGARVGKIASEDSSCRRLRSFSRGLQRFFAEQMQDAAAQHWPLVYTLYAGGDDLLLVAPWQVMLDFAGFLVHEFQHGPAREHGPLTLSAGIALTPYRVPIRHAVERAELLLECAKRQAGKNRCAALGVQWIWDRHGTVLDNGKCIASAVESGGIPRSFLHRLLQLSEVGTGQDRQPRAARWAYQVSRNVPRQHRGEPLATAAFRRWSRDAMSQIDENAQRVDEAVASLRYALLATRTKRRT